MTLRDLTDFPCVVEGDITPAALLAVGAGKLLPLGQYAVAWQDDGKVLLARDPVGCNKLFWARRGEDVVVASRIERLIKEGVALDAIYSCPPGYVISISADAVETVTGADVASLPVAPSEDFDLAAFQGELESEVEATFRWLAKAYKGRRFVVCLSGGMDSTIVALNAKRFLPGASVAVFTYVSAVDAKAHLQGADVSELNSLSDDFRHAVNVAGKLGLKVLPVFRPTDAVAPSVATAARLAQDWRDFNVHCASVNLFLAESIRAAYPGEDVVVLTGDLMNEYVCDYHAEEVDGQVYYPQPRIPFVKRRRFFIRGLDAGDREVGVFTAFGLTLVQPFARLADKFVTVPAEHVEGEDGKWHLNGPLLPADVTAVVGQAKCRAQVGGEDGGTLGIYHHLGLGQDGLLAVWAREMGLDPADPALTALIQFGRYRQYPEGEA